MQKFLQVTAEMAARVAGLGEEELGGEVTRNRARFTRHTQTLRLMRTRSANRSFTVSLRLAERIGRSLSSVFQQSNSSSSSASVEAPTLEAAPSSSGTQQVRGNTPRRPAVRKTTTKKTVKRKKARKIVRRRYVTKKKKIFVENDDGTVTEEVISVRTKVVRRRKKRKTVKKRKTRRSTARRAPADQSARSRLARTLGMVPPATEGQLIPEVCSRRRVAPAVASNYSRAMAGVPTLHIFQPRNELAPVSSGSDGEDVGGGEVGLMSRGRIGLSHRPLERHKAVAMLRVSAPQQRPRAIPQPCEGSPDLLSSIMESQTIWHSKNSNVTIHNDGSVELAPKNEVDVRNGGRERVMSAAPMFPGSSAGPYRPTSGVRPASSTQSRPDGPSSASSGVGFSGAHNDREGYKNYLNNMPARPAPFCRGGPPLRFRMPVRPQLRRIPLLPRRANKALYDDDEDESDGTGDNHDNAREDEKKTAEQEGEPESSDPAVKRSDEDIDLYSDIEAITIEKDCEDDGSYPVLGPPPEPPAFLLSMTMGEDKKDDADVYDPAEPCDSDEEGGGGVEPVQPPPPPPAMLLMSPPKLLDDNDNDDCPVLSLYSSDSLEYSRKGEEERARNFVDNRLDAKEEKPVNADSTATSPRDRVGTRLSFNAEVDEGQESETINKKAESPSKPKSNESEEVNAATAASRSPSPSSSPPRKDSRRSRSNSRPSTSARSRKDSTRSRRSSPSHSLDSSSRGPTSPPKHITSDEEEQSPARARSGRASRLSDVSLERDGDSTHDSKDPREPARTTGLEGLDVEEVSSDMEENDFDSGRLSSLSLSGISVQSRFSSSPTRKKKKKKKRIKSKGKATKDGSEDGEIGSDKESEKIKKTDKKDTKATDENKEANNSRKKQRSKSNSCDRQILSSQENKKKGSDDKELWKKPTKKDRNYREGRKQSKDRGKERRKSSSSSPKRDKKKTKEKKKNDKRKEMERYDVRKVVKEKGNTKKDEFGRDVPTRSASHSKSRSLSRGRVRTAARRSSRSPVRRPSRSPVRRPSRSPVRRPSRSPIRRPSRSPVRRARRRRSKSHSPGSPRRRKSRKSSEREGRRISRRSRSKRRSASRSPRRTERALKASRTRKSRSLSRSPVPRSPLRTRQDFSPHTRARRSISPAPVSRSFPHAWSPGPKLSKGASLENLTVVLTSKDKKKKKRRKDDKREKKTVEGRRKKSGNSKEVFASGDNVLVSVNFSKTNKGNSVIIVPPASPVREVSKKKKRPASDGPTRATKKSKSTINATKTAVDAALSEGPMKRKKLTRLTEEDAEEILNRKPVAVIDLDMSPYREQTPSPINVVVLSDSGSGDESKRPTATRMHSPEIILLPPPSTSTSSAPYAGATGPKTPPEPPLKFSLSAKSMQIRPIANPLAEPDDEPEGLDEQAESAAEKSVEVQHKGPNTPPEPRGPSTPPTVGPTTPRSPHSSQSSPETYDPFEPTKSRSPSPAGQSLETSVEKPTIAEPGNQNTVCVLDSTDDGPKHAELSESQDIMVVNTVEAVSKDTSLSSVEMVELNSSSGGNFNKSVPTRKSTPQPMTPSAASTLPVFSLPSPKTPNRSNAINTSVSGIQRLQHRLGSPVNKTPNSVKSTPEKRTNDTLAANRNSGKRNGPMLDSSNEPIDMDDSPYSPGSSEGDDLFEPPPALPTPAQPPAPPTYKPSKPKTTPVKTPNKFDVLFGSSGPNISPLRNGAKKSIKGGKGVPPKSDKKAIKASTPAKKTVGHGGKMDEDQLRILDEVPSSAVELQVKDKFLKKLNRQERVVDEVKTVLKPHYAKKHISKEQYKDILRRAVPKVCHSKSGEINPSKIQHLVEAYVRKYRHNKKKGPKVQKQPKLMKTTMFS